MTKPAALRAGFHARELGRFDRKHARKETARREMPCRGRAIIRHRAAQFKAAGELLRMLAFHAGLRREIRRAAGDEIETFSSALQHARFAKIALADFVAVGQAIVARGLSRQRDAFRLAPRR